MSFFKETCIEKIYSVSALIGGPGCNGNCLFCAGKYLRKEADADDPQYWRLYEAALKLCARYGGWSLSLTGSGEPTLYPKSITKALEVYQKCAAQGAYFSNVNLFTNGIQFGNRDFCDGYLPLWKSLGLTNIAVSIHSPYEDEQAKAYNLVSYPRFASILDNVRKHGVGVRATLLLRAGGVDSDTSYEGAVRRLTGEGFDNITSWPVGKPDGTANEYTPSYLDIFMIRRWLRNNAVMCHGHAWGGGVYDWNGNILRLTDYVTKHDPKKDYVRQLVVFQGSETGGPEVCYSWIRKGALCMK
jgi:hypothetical protein